MASCNSTICFCVVGKKNIIPPCFVLALSGSMSIGSLFERELRSASKNDYLAQVRSESDNHSFEPWQTWHAWYLPKGSLHSSFQLDGDARITSVPDLAGLCRLHRRPPIAGAFWKLSYGSSLRIAVCTIPPCFDDSFPMSLTARTSLSCSATAGPPNQSRK